MSAIHEGDSQGQVPLAIYIYIYIYIYISYTLHTRMPRHVLYVSLNTGQPTDWQFILLGRCMYLSSRDCISHFVWFQ